jgi:hypothetical protein
MTAPHLPRDRYEIRTYVNAPKPPLNQYFSDIANGTETRIYDEEATVKRIGWFLFSIHVHYRVRTDSNILPDPECVESRVHTGTPSGAEASAKRMMRRIRRDHPLHPKRGEEWTVAP